MSMFKGFKPQGLQKIASKMGYAGRMEEFDSYLQQNPDKQREMIVFQQKAQEMARGGSVVRMANGGSTQPIDYFLPGTNPPLAPGETRMGEVNPKYTDGQINVMQPIAQQPSQKQLSDMEQFPIADFQPMPQQVDTPIGLPQGIDIQPGLGGGDYSTFIKDPRDTSISATPEDPITGFDPNAGFTRQQTEGLKRQQAEGLKRQQAEKGSPYGTPISVEDLVKRFPNIPEHFKRMSFQNAQSRASQRDVKSAEEQAAIDATLSRGPDYAYRESQRQQAEEARQKSNNYGMPQSYIDTNYKTNDGTKFVVPFKSNMNPLKLYPTEESYRNYISNQVDEQIRQTQEGRKSLEASGYVENAPDERGYIYYTKQGSNQRIGMPPRIADVNSFKQQRIQESLQQRQQRIDEAAKYGDERLAFGERFGQGPEDIVRSIAGSKQLLQEQNNRLTKIGLQPIDAGYFDSPEYKYYLENQSMFSQPASGFSSFFGPSSQSAPGEDASYVAYLTRTGKDSIIQKANQIRKSYDNNPSMYMQGPLLKNSLIDTGTKPTTYTDIDGTTKTVMGLNETLPSDFIDAPSLLKSDAPAQDTRGNPAMTTSNPLPQQPTPVQGYTEGMNITDVTAQRLSAPSLPSGGQVVGQGINQEAGQYVDASQGQVSGSVAVPTSLATTTQAQMATPTDANIMTATQSSGQVGATLQGTQAAQIDPNNPSAQVNAAQNAASSVSQLQAAQGVANVMQNPMQRQIRAGEVINGVANAQAASTYAEQIQAATATPSAKATVQGQLEQLTANFNASNPPAWAAGTLRGVQAQMAARGLGASSMAGQAMIQGALESALPIAQADAGIQAQFETQNLSNRQQRAMLAAQQRATFIGQEFDQAFQARVQNSARISDIANMNFTAEQNVALENSRAVNTMSLQNVSNNQAMVIAEASALANMDMSNLSNRQQASVQNAQAFMQMDMANLSNQQQTELFKAQQRVQSLFTDQAATNAASQFNASSQNQVEQFFANLATQSSQFNATQANAQSQYNSGQRNVLERFNAELNNQRDTFNAQNRLVIDQNNATWRRQIATSDTATINRVNEINATNMLATSTQAYNNLWNYYGDTMEWAWTSAENELNRYADMSIANLNADTQSAVAKRGESTAAGSAIGSLIGTLGSAYIASSFCWVAREVYGKGDPRWYVFRLWLKNKAPKWFKNMYEEYGEDYAKFIKKKPVWKWLTKKLMDLVVEKKRMVSHV